MMYQTNVESICSDLTPDDGETRGIISDTYTIGMSLSMEFNAVGVWYTFMMDGINEKRNAPMDNIMETDPNRIVPIYSIPLEYDLGLEKGWKIQTSVIYHPAKDIVGIDETDISSILDQSSVKALIEHHTAMHIPLHEFLEFRVFKGSKEIPRGVKGFDISLEKKLLYTYNPEPNVPYRIFVLINALAINNMATEIAKFNRT
jgi:hypothetical protein